MGVTLEHTLSYSNPSIIQRFARKHKVSLSDAEEIFTETLKMLWLMALRQEEERNSFSSTPNKFLLYPQMGVLDEMWHNFILFTKEYSAFCEAHFGHYLHHAPTTDSEKHAEDSQKDLENQCRYIGQKLGTSTLKKWFQEYPFRFSSIK